MHADGFCVQLDVLKRFSFHRRVDTPAWLSRADWASGKVVSGNQRRVWTATGIALIWTLASIQSIDSLPAELRSGREIFSLDHLAVLVCAGLWAWAALEWIRWRTWGTSILELDHVPTDLGASWIARIQAPLELRNAERVQLKLTCVEHMRGKQNMGETKLLWEHAYALETHELKLGPIGIEIPVQFSIPADIPETLLDSRDRAIRWMLHARAPVSGLDYAATFDVPVFRAV